jgi:hypothetical protein
MLSPYPQYTKQTRCNNDLKLESKQDFFRPMISNQTIPLTHNHENYIMDHLDIERSSISTRNNCTDSRKPVQTGFQNDYYTASFKNEQYNDNKLYERNPVNTRRDALEKVRNNEQKDFMKNQGGMMSNFTDFKVQNTRENKNVLNSSNYIPMPRTMAIPKENI